jgi:hypothetical protein
VLSVVEGGGEELGGGDSVGEQPCGGEGFGFEVRAVSGFGRFVDDEGAAALPVGEECRELFEDLRQQAGDRSQGVQGRLDVGGLAQDRPLLITRVGSGGDEPHHLGRYGQVLEPDRPESAGARRTGPRGSARHRAVRQQPDRSRSWPANLRLSR